MKRTDCGFISVLVISALLRAPYLYRYGDVANLDEANIGVMGMDILKGDIPLFMYGHSYFGPLEAMFEALFLLFFPPSPLALRLAILTIYLLSVFVLWRGARLLLNKEGAMMATAWFAIGPVILTIWSILPNGAHIAGLLTGALIFYMSARIIVAEKTSIFFYLLFGLVIGFSLWNHPGNLLHVLCAVIMILVAKPGVVKGFGIPVSLAGCGLGGLPFWMAIVKSHMSSVEFGQAHEAGKPLSELLANTGDTVGLLPTFMGFGLVPAYIGWPVMLVFGGILSASLGWLAVGLYARSRSALPALFGWLLTLATITAYTMLDPSASHGGAAQYRYLLPIILGLSCVLGFTYQRMAEKWKPAGWAMPLFLLTVNVGINIYAFPTRAYDVYINDTRLDDRFFKYKELIDPLERLGVGAAYVPFYDDCSIVYETGGKVIASAYTDSRLKKYSLMAQADDNPAFAIEKNNAGYFEVNLKTALAKYKVERGKNYNIYYDISAPPGVFVPIERGDIKATAHPHSDDAKYALDGDMDTLWNSNRPQAGDEAITLDLGRTTQLARIDIIPSGHTDAPGHIAIDISTNGQGWTTVADTPDISSFIWTGPHITWEAWEGFNQYIFTPVMARYVRIRQKASSRWHWHVREIYLYSYKGGTKPAGPPEWDSVIAFMKKRNISTVIGDFYFSANIILESSGSIWANMRYNNLNKDPREKWEFSMDEFDATAVHERDAMLVKRFFDRQGYRYDVKTFGPYSLFYNLKSSADNVKILDDKICEQTGENQMVCDMREPTRFSAFRPGANISMARPSEMFYSNDGESWADGGPVQKLYRSARWTGSHLIGMRASDIYVVHPVNTRYVKLMFGKP